MNGASADWTVTLGAASVTAAGNGSALMAQYRTSRQNDAPPHRPHIPAPTRSVRSTHGTPVMVLRSTRIGSSLCARRESVVAWCGGIVGTPRAAGGRMPLRSCIDRRPTAKVGPLPRTVPIAERRGRGRARGFRGPVGLAGLARRRPSVVRGRSVVGGGAGAPRPPWSP
jgi:hypothetical protein